MQERQPEMQNDMFQTRPGDLKPLGELKDWALAPDKPDIRGWKLVDIDGKDYGKLEDLLVDTKSGQALFGIVRHGLLIGLGDKQTLVPLDMIRIDRDNKLVKFFGSPDLLRSAPEYKKDIHDFSGFYDYWGSKYGEVEEAEERSKQSSPVDRGRLLSEKLEEQYYKHHPEETGTAQQAGAQGTRIGRIPIVRQGVEEETPQVQGVEPGQTVIHEGEKVEIPIVGERTVVTGKVVIEAKPKEEEEKEEEDEE